MKLIASLLTSVFIIPLFFVVVYAQEIQELYVEEPLRVEIKRLQSLTDENKQAKVLEIFLTKHKQFDPKAIEEFENIYNYLIQLALQIKKDQELIKDLNGLLMLKYTGKSTDSIYKKKGEEFAERLDTMKVQILPLLQGDSFLIRGIEVKYRLDGLFSGFFAARKFERQKQELEDIKTDIINLQKELLKMISLLNVE